MTKFITTAAWAALVLGGSAVADTPPAEAEVTVEETTEVTTEAEAPTTITRTYRYGDETAAEVTETTDSAGTVANVTIDGEVEADTEVEVTSDAEGNLETEVEITEDADVEMEAAPEGE